MVDDYSRLLELLVMDLTCNTVISILSLVEDKNILRS